MFIEMSVKQVSLLKTNSRLVYEEAVYNNYGKIQPKGGSSNGRNDALK